MSLFVLANNDNSLNGGIYNNAYKCSFKTPIDLPSHAKVSLVKAYIPVSPVINITSTNNRFLMSFNSPSNGSNCKFTTNPTTITLTNGIYETYEDFLQQFKMDIQNAFKSPIALTIGDTIPLFWSPANDTQSWNFSTTLNLDKSVSFQIFPFNQYDLLTTSYRNINWKMDFSTSISGNGKDSLANIFGIAFTDSKTGAKTASYGILETSINTTKNFPANIILTTGVLNSNGTSPNVPEFEGAFLVEVPELGTQLYNSGIKDRISAVGVIPYSQTDLNDGFIMYDTDFPYELQGSNEEQLRITELNVRIRDLSGELSSIYSETRRTFIVLRIETTYDIEKRLLHNVKYEKRKNFIENSLINKLP